jgi:hypothetical protein
MCTFTSEGSIDVPCTIHEAWLKTARLEFISAASWREKMLLNDARRSYAEALERSPHNELEIAALARVIGSAEMLGSPQS